MLLKGATGWRRLSKSSIKETDAPERSSRLEKTGNLRFFAAAAVAYSKMVIDHFLRASRTQK